MSDGDDQEWRGAATGVSAATSRGKRAIAIASRDRRWHSQKAAPRRPLPEDPELARLVAGAREIDRRYNEELGRRVRQLSDEELGQFVSYLMRTREPDDDDEEAEDE